MYHPISGEKATCTARMRFLRYVPKKHGTPSYAKVYSTELYVQKSYGGQAGRNDTMCE